MTSPNPMPSLDELTDGNDQSVPFFSSFGERLMDLLIREPGWDLLEIGAGRGGVSPAAVARGFTVTATDAAPALVASLRADHPGINAAVMDPHRLDFKDDSFDIATAAFVIDVIDDPAQVLHEVCRVVRPGGLVAMTVPEAVDDEGRWEQFHQVSAAGTAVTGRAALARPTDVAEVFAQAGLTDLREESIEVRLPVGSGGIVLHRGAEVHLGRLPA